MYFQTVPKVRNRQNRFTFLWIFSPCVLIQKAEYLEFYNAKKCLLRKDFDLLRNSRPTVPMYADGRELLAFRTFWQSVSVPKRVFRHAEKTPNALHSVFFIIYAIFSRESIDGQRKMCYTCNLYCNSIAKHTFSLSESIIPRFAGRCKREITKNVQRTRAYHFLFPRADTKKPSGGRRCSAHGKIRHSKRITPYDNRKA